MNLKMVLLTIFIIIVILLGIIFAIGIYFKDKCYELGDCKKCWVVTNETEKYNSMIDIILCACQRTKSNEYSDQSLNNKIMSLYKSITGSSGDVKDICEGKLPLVKYK